MDMVPKNLELFLDLILYSSPQKSEDSTTLCDGALIWPILCQYQVKDYDNLAKNIKWSMYKWQNIVQTYYASLFDPKKIQVQSWIYNPPVILIEIQLIFLFSSVELDFQLNLYLSYLTHPKIVGYCHEFFVKF